jgi:hypothetical protein
MPSANCLNARRAAAPPPDETYAVRPSTASAVASAPSTMSQAGARSPSMVCHVPYRVST